MVLLTLLCIPARLKWDVASFKGVPFLLVFTRETIAFHILFNFPYK